MTMNENETYEITIVGVCVCVPSNFRTINSFTKLTREVKLVKVPST
jgi:hypothetical protein